MELNMPELFDQNLTRKKAGFAKPTEFGKFGDEILQFQLLVLRYNPLTHTPSQTDKTSIIAYARLCNREIQILALTDVCAFTHHPAFLLACIYSNVFFILQRDSFQMY